MVIPEHLKQLVSESRRRILDPFEIGAIETLPLHDRLEGPPLRDAVLAAQQRFAKRAAETKPRKNDEPEWLLDKQARL
jgi:hypothetical protein